LEREHHVDVDAGKTAGVVVGLRTSLNEIKPDQHPLREREGEK
jgi:hypothetical protein